MAQKKSIRDYIGYILAGVFITFLLLGMIIGRVREDLAPIFYIFAFTGSVLPYLLINYFEFAKYKKMEEFFPFFLRDFAEAIRSGMTFTQALNITSKIDYGALTNELKKAAAQLSWGMPFDKVLEKMSERIKGSKTIRQAIAIIIETYNSGGDVTQTMDSLANSVTVLRDIKLERKSMINQQITVMYFVFVMFLVLIVAMDKFLIGKFLSSATSAQVDVGVIKGALFSQVDYCAYPVGNIVCAFGKAFGFEGQALYYKGLFLLMALVQSVCMGAIIGIMTDNKIKAGFMHMAVMTSLSIIILTVAL